MKLYMHPASPNCRKVVVTAAYLGIPLETELVDIINGAQRSPQYLAINPNGAVPLLEDGDFRLSESNAIMQYLAAKKPGNTLWPKDERARVDICRWQCWELAHWLPALSPFLFENMFKQLLGRGAPDQEVLKRAEEKFNRYTGVLNSHLEGREFLVGKGFTLADISVASELMYAEAARLPLDGCPNIKRWYAQIERLPAWRETAPQVS